MCIFTNARPRSGPPGEPWTTRVVTCLAGAAATLMVIGMAGEGHAAVRQPRQETVSKRVSYADLNLGSPMGRRTLLRRVTAAAEVVCEAPRAHVLTTLSPSARRCVQTAVAGAMAQAQPAIQLAQRN